MGWRALQDYAFATRCRQQHINHWFTAELGDPCGRCDACTGAGVVAAEVAAARARSAERMASRAAKKAADASVILDEAQRQSVLDFVDALKKPVGRKLVTQGLRGSKAKPVKRKGLMKNPQHGALKGVPEDAIFRAIDDLLDDGRLARKGRKYPTLWMADKRVRPKRDPNKPRKPKPTGLLAQLKEWRKKEARRRRWRAYQVCTDATLQAIVDSRPSTLSELGLPPHTK